MTGPIRENRRNQSDQAPLISPGPQLPWQSVPADKGDIPGVAGALLSRAGPPHPAQELEALPRHPLAPPTLPKTKKIL